METNTRRVNEKIAKFMNLGIQLHMFENPFTGEYIDMEDSEYHKSWDWLMPVLLKVGTICTFTIDSTFEWNGKDYDCRYQITIRDKAGKDIAIQDQSDLLQATLLAVIESIEWYNIYYISNF